MARVEDGRQTDTLLERLDHVVVNLIVNDVAVVLKVDRVDNFVVAIVFVAVLVFGLSAVS